MEILLLIVAIIKELIFPIFVMTMLYLIYKKM